MNKRDAKLILPSLTFLIAIVSFFVVYKFLLPNVVENTAKISAYDQDIIAASDKISSLSTADASMAKLSDLVNNLLVAIPATADSPDLIAEVETIAAQNQVALPSISPPSSTSASTSSSTATSAGGTAVSISIIGTFANINNFISSLESSIRYSKIDSITITSSSDNTLSASISFEVFKRPVSSSGAK